MASGKTYYCSALVMGASKPSECVLYVTEKSMCCNFTHLTEFAIFCNYDAFSETQIFGYRYMKNNFCKHA